MLQQTSANTPEDGSLPAGIDWTHWRTEGERRRAEVQHLELVRSVFRRPLELWLVTDRAVALDEAGFTVQVSNFCARSPTPATSCCRHGAECSHM